MLSLATRCGIQTPAKRIERLGDESILMVKRFDRERVANLYHHSRMVSALTVLQAEEQDRSRWSYLLFADEVQRWSHRAREDQAELFQRMVLNALVTNIDDHPRNHALLARDQDWQLSPAYDITPDPMHGSHKRSLAMACGAFGRMAQRRNLIAGAARFRLASDEATRKRCRTASRSCISYK